MYRTAPRPLARLWLYRPDFLIDSADRVFTCRGPAPRRGLAQRDAGLIEHASVASCKGVIVQVGPADAVRRGVTLTAAGVVATLLPTAAFYLKLGRFAPARMLIDHGVAVALASDVNPGGGFSPSMPFAMTLACFGMSMTLEEALIAATLNGAVALNRADRVGSLEVGKQMDAVIVDGTLADLTRVGAPVIRDVIKRGAVVA